MQFKIIINTINAISEWSGEILKYLLIAITILVFGEVVLRYVFNAPTIWGYEITEYLFGSLSLMGGAYCLRYKIHVNVSFLPNRLSTKGKAILEIVTSPIIIFFCVCLLMKGAEFAWGTIINYEHSGTVWNPPYWPYAMVLPLSVLLLLAQLLADLANNIIIAFRKDIENEP